MASGRTRASAHGCLLLLTPLALSNQASVLVYRGGQESPTPPSHVVCPASLNPMHTACIPQDTMWEDWRHSLPVATALLQVGAGKRGRNEDGPQPADVTWHIFLSLPLTTRNEKRGWGHLLAGLPDQSCLLTSALLASAPGGPRTPCPLAISTHVAEVRKPEPPL